MQPAWGSMKLWLDAASCTLLHFWRTMLGFGELGVSLQNANFVQDPFATCWSHLVALQLSQRESCQREAADFCQYHPPHPWLEQRVCTSSLAHARVQFVADVAE